MVFIAITSGFKTLQISGFHSDFPEDLRSRSRFWLWLCIEACILAHSGNATMDVTSLCSMDEGLYYDTSLCKIKYSRRWHLYRSITADSHTANICREVGYCPWSGLGARYILSTVIFQESRVLLYFSNWWYGYLLEIKVRSLSENSFLPWLLELLTTINFPQLNFIV
jgi:hypothetical protein